MLVGDGAACVDGSFIAGVIRGYGALSDGVGDHLTICVVLGQALPGVSPGIAVLGGGDSGSRSGGAGRYVVKGQGERLRPDAVAVAVVVPDFVYGHVHQRKFVGEGHLVSLCIISDDGTGGGLVVSLESVVIRTGVLSADELEVGYVALGESVFGSGRKVGEAEVPAGLHLNRDITAAWRVVIAVGTGAGSTDDRGVHDGFAGDRVVNREPNPVIGVVLRIVVRLILRSLAVFNVQGEREERIRVRAFAGDDLFQVEVGTAVVGRGQGCDSRVHIVCCPFDLIGSLAGGIVAVLFIFLDKDRRHHNQVAVFI